MKPTCILLSAAALAGVLLLTACSGKEGGESQVLARVEGVEITVHQLENALRVAKTQKRDEATRTRLLEQMIDRELAVLQARQLKLDERPEVMLRIEELRRDALASTWGDSITDSASPPEEADLKRYHDENPALFSQRRVYVIEETVWPLLDDTVRSVWQASKALPGNQIVAALREKNAPFKTQTVRKATESLPIEVAAELLKLNNSEAYVMFATPQVLMAYRPVSFQIAPLDFATARPRIEAFLTREHGEKALAGAIAELRKTARIEYLNGSGPVKDE